MPGDRSRIVAALLLCAMIFTACTTASSAPAARPAASALRATPTGQARATLTPTPTIAPPADGTPARYRAQVVLRGVGRPDDLTFDRQGQLLFSDALNGTVNRLNSDGSVAVLARGLAGPEGLAVLQNGTIIIAEQRTNRLLALAPGAPMPTVLRTLPGQPSTKPCKDGVDGIALDSATQTLIVPDSPTGDVYRVSLDGKVLRLLASGMVRPVGAAVDPRGNVYVADECGHAVWRISPRGQKTRLGGFGMPDDVAIDRHGNILVIDLAPAVHALIRVRAATGQHETLARQGFIEPQGLVLDQHDHIFVADDYANMIVEFTPV
jgi:glucose/arabinose dehydrogenase